MYYIYHIPGIKIGCTTNPKNRIKKQGFINYEILEIHKCPKIAGDRELQLQADYGYKIDNCHYLQIIEAGNKAHISNIGRTISEEHKNKLSIVHKGKTISEEHKAKISAANKNTIISDETKIKMSIAKKGILKSKEIRSKMSIAKKGSIVSEETKNKISIANKGKIVSEESKAKISAANKGKAKPKIECPYCKKYISPAMLKRWHGDNCKQKSNI